MTVERRGVALCSASGWELNMSVRDVVQAAAGVGGGAEYQVAGITVPYTEPILSTFGDSVARIGDYVYALSYKNATATNREIGILVKLSSDLSTIEGSLVLGNAGSNSAQRASIRVSAFDKVNEKVYIAGSWGELSDQAFAKIDLATMAWEWNGSLNNNYPVQPGSMAVDSNGDLYLLCGSSGNRLVKINKSTGAQIWCKLLNTSYGGTMTSDGTDIYLGSQAGNTTAITKISSSGTLIYTRNVNPNGGASCFELQYYDGNLYAAFEDVRSSSGVYTTEIVKFDSTGYYQAARILGATDGSNRPYQPSLAVDDSGVYISVSSSNYATWHVAKTNSLSDFSFEWQGTLYNPQGTSSNPSFSLMDIDDDHVYINQSRRIASSTVAGMTVVKVPKDGSLIGAGFLDSTGGSFFSITTSSITLSDGGTAVDNYTPQTIPQNTVTLTLTTYI